MNDRLDVLLNTDTLTLYLGAVTLCFNVSTNVGQGIVDTVSIVTDVSVAIVDTDDLLKGIIKETNRSALGRGIRTGMTGREALDLL